MVLCKVAGFCWPKKRIRILSASGEKRNSVSTCARTGLRLPANRPWRTWLTNVIGSRKMVWMLSGSCFCTLAKKLGLKRTTVVSVEENQPRW